MLDPAHVDAARGWTTSWLRRAVGPTSGFEIVEEAVESGDGARFRRRYELPADAPLLCLLPGSRGSEVRCHMPVIEQATTLIWRRVSQLRLVLPTLPSLAPLVKRLTARWKLPVLVLEDRAAEVFEGPMPSPFMLFTHRVRPGWASRIPAALHVDGTARIQTVGRDREPLVARMLEAVERRTGAPVVINTSLNTAGRPMVDDPRDALECFGSAPVDALAIGPFLVRRAAA